MLWSDEHESGFSAGSFSGNRDTHLWIDEYVGVGKPMFRLNPWNVFFSARDLGLTFSNKGTLELIGYADASYLTHHDAKSHNGLAYSLGEGSTACFFSKSSEQKLVTRSSVEAELYALGQCVCDIEWFRAILKILSSEQINPTPIFEDNQSAMASAEGSTIVRNCSEHLNMRYLYCKQAIKNNEVTLKSKISSHRYFNKTHNKF